MGLSPAIAVLAHEVVVRQVGEKNLLEPLQCPDLDPTAADSTAEENHARDCVNDVESARFEVRETARTTSHSTG